jgi:2-polyprenyl-3-methyl-5-hydroxy-6-metoxy-1,4-benzoquinol methylase
MSQQNFQRYEKYSEYSYESSGYKKLEYIVKNIQISIGSSKCRILEIGCGNGNISTVLASFGHEVLAIDMSEDCIRYATDLKEKLNLKTLSIKMLNATEIHSSVEPFDVVICSEILEHLDAPESVVSKAYSVLRPGGILIVTVPNGYGPYELSGKVGRTLSGLISKNPGLANLRRSLSALTKQLSPGDRCVQSVNAGEGSAHIQFFTQKRLRQIFLAAKFRVIASGSSDFIAHAAPFSALIPQSKLLCRIDFALADILPSAAVSGWYFTLEKQSPAK